jgi:pSer/pThr/pTyr-binding forkhead associated (FHA) protein
MPRIVLQELDSDKALSVGELDALVGRDPACALLIEGTKSRVVSGRHARIFFQDGAWWIQDMSRNGTILDEERLQAGQRHALRAGQVIGLGESGPRFRVMTLEARNVAETMLESNLVVPDKQTTAPRVRPRVGLASAGNPQEGTTALPTPMGEPVSVQFEEATEPAKLSGAWHISIVLRATHSDQRFDAKASVVKVGRSPECHVRIPPEQGASVSRVHCEIAIGESGVVVRDAGSRNGTFVNGSKIQGAHPIIVGDKVTLGSGGPSLEVDDLHIMRGEVVRTEPAGRSPGGGPTPDARQIGQPFREPPTAPAPLDEAIPAATRVHVTGAPASVGQPVVASETPAKPAPTGRNRILLFVIIGVLLLVVAVLVGRLSAS